MKDSKKNNKFRKSRQRDRIYELLKSTTQHPTANWIYDNIKDQFPNLSLGTIYRNVNILIEQRLIQKIDFGSTFDRFDANTDEHYHFICENCSAIIDLDIPIDPKLNEKINMKTKFKVYRHNIEFYGKCDKCSR